MANNLNGSGLKIEHDHTLMQVLLEDLKAVARQAFVTADPVLLEDARYTWKVLVGEITRHFAGEEKMIFSVFSILYPDVKENLAELGRQHRALQSHLLALGELLEGVIGDVSGQGDRFALHWTEFELLWHAHSVLEWQVFEEIRGRVQRPLRLLVPALQEEARLKS